MNKTENISNPGEIDNKSNKVSAVGKIEEENSLSFRWTKHVFLLANVLIIIGIGISWAVANTTHTNYSNNWIYTILPVMICSILSLGLWFLSFYYSHKDIKIISASIHKKYIKLFELGNILFLLFVFIASGCFVVFNIIFISNGYLGIKWSYIITLVVSAVLSLPVVAINRYALFCSEYELYKKRYGEKK